MPPPRTDTRRDQVPRLTDIDRVLDVPIFEPPDIIASANPRAFSAFRINCGAPSASTSNVPRFPWMLVARPAAFVDDDSPSHPRGTFCFVRLRMYTCLRWMNVPRVYSQGSTPSDPRNLWTDWMSAIIEEESGSLTVCGTIIKSYIVRAERMHDRRLIRLRVIPYFGEMYVPDLSMARGAILPRVPLASVEYYRRCLDATTVWAGILTDVVSKQTGTHTLSHIWYRVALELNDRAMEKRYLATVHGGPYDIPSRRCYLRISLGESVLLLPGDLSKAVLRAMGATVWDEAEAVLGMAHTEYAPARVLPTVCCDPGRGVLRTTPATVEWVRYT